jgi:hypothetical protein
VAELAYASTAGCGTAARSAVVAAYASMAGCGHAARSAVASCAFASTASNVLIVISAVL